MSDFPALIDLENLGSYGFKILGDAAEDKAGRSVSDAGDVNGDGFDDFIIGAMGNDSGGNAAGAAYVIFGKAGGFALIDLAALSAADGFKIQGDAAVDYAGRSVSSAGDVNGDGFDDMLVGGHWVGTPNTGGAYLIFGKGTAFGTVDLGSLAAADGFRILGAAEDDYAGYSVSSAGDVNGDGFDDMLVGALLHDAGGNYAGAAYLIFGKEGGFADISLANLAANDDFVRFIGDTGGDRAGVSVSSLGDINNDGFDDIIIGANGNDATGDRAGTAYVIFGKAGPFNGIDLTNLAPADGFRIHGEAPVDNAGFSVSSAGDINGDGFDDIFVSGHANDGAGYGAGAAYVVFGKAEGFGTINLAALAAADGFKIRGAAILDFAGSSLSSAGDVNADGFDDIFVGAPGHDSGGSNAGAAYVIFGKAGGFTQIDLATLAVDDGFKIQGDAAQNQAGWSVSTAGDVNGDGFDDMVVGVHRNDAGGADAGAAYLIFGIAPTEGVTRVGAAADQTIRGGIGDDSLDGAGGDDDLFGAAGNDILDGGAGADSMNGGLGDDLYFIDNAGDQVIEGLDAGTDEVRTAFASYTLAENVETLTGTAGTDQALTGNGLDNTIAAGAGNDMLDGGAGADAMAGGGGHDVYVVDNLGDTVTELDGAGTDEVRTNLGSKAAPDYALYVLPNFLENLTGTSAGAQGVRGNALNNVIVMGLGADLIVLDDGGVDSIDAGGGNDFIYYGATLTGADTTNGGAGTDTLGLLGNYTGGNAITFTAANLIGVERLALYTGGGTNSYSVTMNDANVPAGGDFFVTAASLTSTETLFFNGFAEASGRFTVLGGSGADTIVGGRGADYLAGNAGADILYALAGNDFIIGGLGADQLTGGGGFDQFRYLSTADSTTGSVDQISDFTDLDRIDLSGIDANANAGDGDTAFTFIGTGVFTNVAGQLRATGSGSAWTVEGDVNGDGIADLIIQVTISDPSLPALGATDFIL